MLRDRQSMTTKQKHKHKEANENSKEVQFLGDLESKIIMFIMFTYYYVYLC